MAVKNWHFGKIVILWVCTMLPIAALLVVLMEARFHPMEFLLIIFAAVLLAFIFLVPITWKWLSSKEKRD